MSKQRVTSHHGRCGSTVHNGRGFDVEHTPHIDPDRVRGDMYVCVAQAEDGSWGYSYAPEQAEFLQAEQAYYTDRFGQSLGLQNDRHIAARHYDRVKTMEDVYNGQNTRPMEQILQIGDKDSHTDPVLMRKAWTDYLRWMRQWSADHGNCLRLLSSAYHVDEASPHAHNRYVWEYMDSDGVVHINQDKAMQQAGLELPDPTQPRSRYNNRAMTWATISREAWIGICKGYGIDVELEPIKGRKHKSKEDYIAEQERKKDLDRRERAVEVRERALQAAETQAKAEADRIHQDAQRASDGLLDAAKAEADRIHQEAVEAAQKDAEAIRNAAEEQAAEELAKAQATVTPKERRLLEIAKRMPLKGGGTVYDALERKFRTDSIDAPRPDQQPNRQHGRDI